MNPARIDNLRNRNTNFFTKGARTTVDASQSPNITEECNVEEAKSPTGTGDSTNFKLRNN